MAPIKYVLFLCTMTISCASYSELVNITETEMSDVSGQSGVTFEGTVDLSIADIAYQQTPDSSYQVLHNIIANYEYGPTTLDVTSNGSIRFGLPEFIHFNELSLGLYNSNTAIVDPNNSVNSQTYTIYASTLGDAYDDFTLDINGTTLDSGNTRWNGTYINTNTLESNASNTFTITESGDINIRLESEDDGFFSEDFAQITLVDEEGNILAQEGQTGSNDANLNFHFESPVNNNFLVQATLTGTLKMGGAIEMFSASNVAFKR